MIEYILDNIKKSMGDSDSYDMYISKVKQFAYDQELPLFPDSEIEQAKAILRSQFEAGKSIDFKVLTKDVKV